LLNYYVDDVGELYMYMCIYFVGEFSYMLLVMTWWCKYVLKYVDDDIMMTLIELWLVDGVDVNTW